MSAKRLACLIFCVFLSSSWSQPQSPKRGGAPTVLRQKALALEAQGSTTEAEQAWHAFLQADPGSAEAYAHLGLLAARAEDYEKAIPLYRKSLKLNSRVSGVRMNLGLALFKSEHLREAIQQFSVLLKSPATSRGDKMRLQTLIGMAHYGLGEYSEAVPFLKDAAAGDQKNLTIRLILAHSCLWSKQNQCVLDTYKEILSIDPQSAEADMLAGEALDEMKNSQGALEQFRAAEKANPKEPNVHFGTGYLLWRSKQYPEAAAEFQLELENNPQHAQSMLYLGDVLLQLNKPEDARRYLEKALPEDSSGLANLDLGIIDADAGHTDDALRELQLAEKQQPNEVNVHWRLGRLYRALGRKEEAKAEFEAASKLNKSADEDLIKKIDDGRKHPPRGAAAEPSTPQH